MSTSASEAPVENGALAPPAPEKRKAESVDASEEQGDHQDSKSKKQKGHGGEKNIPAHRNAFKRHLRKHTLLFQREKGETPSAFVITCDQGKEARSIQSSVELIKLALASLPSSGESDGEDTWVCDPGCNGVVCVTIERKGVDPVLHLLPALWDHVQELGRRDKAALKDFANKHKFCYRFVPMQVMCRATMDDITGTLSRLLSQPPFGESSPATTFAVTCEVRSCNSMTKKEIIDKVAGMVQPKHKVQLYLPDTLIVVQVLKSACGISVVPKAARYCRSQKSTFNLLQYADSVLGGEQASDRKRVPAAASGEGSASQPSAASKEEGSGS